MDVYQKLRLIDMLSMLLFFIMMTGVLIILVQDNFQFFFNIRLLAFVGVLSIIGLILMRKRQDLFAETL